MRDRQTANIVCNARFVGEMRSILCPAGDGVDILERAENNMSDTCLNRCIRQLAADGSLYCLRWHDGRRHQKCPVRAFESSNEILLETKLERDGYNFSSKFLQT